MTKQILFTFAIVVAVALPAVTFAAKFPIGHKHGKLYNFCIFIACLLALIKNSGYVKNYIDGLLFDVVWNRSMLKTGFSFSVKIYFSQDNCVSKPHQLIFN